MKKILLGLVCLNLAFAAKASYLYWQVDASDFTGDLTAENKVDPASADKAVVKYYATVGGSIDAGNNASATSYYITSLDPYATTEGTALSFGTPYTIDLRTIADADQYSYYIELQNSSQGNSFVARSQAMTYSELAAQQSIYEASLAVVPTAAVWHATGYTAAPEPTSAILMLFGAAMLGLKRKNRSIA